MIGLLCAFTALLGIANLFFKSPSHRTLPWWVDVLVILGAAVVYVVSMVILYGCGGNDDDDA